MVQFLMRGEDPSERIGRQLGGIVEAGFEGYKQGREKKRLETERQRLSQQLGMDLSSNPDIAKVQIAESLRGNQNRLDTEFKEQIESKRYDAIKNRWGNEAAELYRAAPEGGKTKLIEHLLEDDFRNNRFFSQHPEMNSELPPDFQNTEQDFSPENFGEMQFQENEIEPIKEKGKENLSYADKIYKELDDYVKNQDTNLLPKEKLEVGKQRYSTNLEFYNQANDKIRASDADKDRFNMLDKLNKSDKLPKGMGRLNVDKEGNLRLPFFASEEAQRFVKVLNEFSRNAKDTFGSRVTNFDLTQYLKQFPTLLNSKEGREQLIQQMKIVNDINKAYYSSLRSVYDRAGGVRNIDADIATKYATMLSEPKINKLRERFDTIGQFTTQPNAQEFAGKKIRNTKTGEILISDGQNWIPENQQ